MSHLGSMPDPKDKPRTLLVGWISRLDLALELGLSVDTLRRWDAQRMGPPSPPVSGKLSAALLFSIFQVGGIGR